MTTGPRQAASLLGISLLLAVTASVPACGRHIPKTHLKDREAQRFGGLNASNTACGLNGYLECGQDLGGGCCPTGYQCGIDDCTAVTSTLVPVCPTEYLPCPTSGGGAGSSANCCSSGLACTNGACIATPGMNFGSTWAYTFTTSYSGETKPVTITEVGTIETIARQTETLSPVPPTVTNSPWTQTKLKATEPPSPSPTPSQSPSPTPSASSSNALTPAQIGAISGGAAALLLVFALIIFLILRRMRRLSNYIESRLGPAAVDQAISGPGKPETGGAHLAVGMMAPVCEVEGSGFGSTGEMAGSYSGAHGVSELDAVGMPPYVQWVPGDAMIQPHIPSWEQQNNTWHAAPMDASLPDTTATTPSTARRASQPFNQSRTSWTG